MKVDIVDHDDDSPAEDLRRDVINIVQVLTSLMIFHTSNTTRVVANPSLGEPARKRLDMMPSILPFQCQPFSLFKVLVLSMKGSITIVQDVLRRTSLTSSH